MKIYIVNIGTEQFTKRYGKKILYIKIILDMRQAVSETENADFKQEQKYNILRLGHRWKIKTLSLKLILLVLYTKILLLLKRHQNKRLINFLISFKTTLARKVKINSTSDFICFYSFFGNYWLIFPIHWLCLIPVRAFFLTKVTLMGNINKDQRTFINSQNTEHKTLAIKLN